MFVLRQMRCVCYLKQRRDFCRNGRVFEWLGLLGGENLESAVALWRKFHGLNGRPKMLETKLTCDWLNDSLDTLQV